MPEAVFLRDVDLNRRPEMKGVSAVLQLALNP